MYYFKFIYGIVDYLLLCYMDGTLADCHLRENEKLLDILKYESFSGCLYAELPKSKFPTVEKSYS